LKQMKSIISVAAILMLASINGCGQDDKPVIAADSGVLKAQLKTLEQAKQVEQVVQEAADQQRQKIAAETQ
jgi:predicted small lipoprotein YifL